MDVLPDNALRTAPRPTLKRLPLYLRLIRGLVHDGETYISSAVLAKELNLDPIVVRKDLAVTGVTGLPRLGFPAKAAELSILNFLGWNNTTDAILCGAGSLGRALLGYDGFKQHGLSIVAAFDVNPGVIGTMERGVHVLSMSEMEKIVPRMRVRLGIVTVPASAAQEVADRMVSSGIKGIWNFTPVKLSVPDDIVIQRVDLAASLAVLSHNLSLLDRHSSKNPT